MSLNIGSKITVRGTEYTVRCIGPNGEGKFFGRRAFLLEDGAGNFAQGYGKTLTANSKLTEVSSDVSRALWTQRGFTFPAEPETAEETDAGTYNPHPEWPIEPLCCSYHYPVSGAPEEIPAETEDPTYISDVKVRQLAAGWAGGADELQALATTGAILPGLSDLVRRLLDPKMSHDGTYPPGNSPEAEELRSILRYANYHGERGRVAGWSNLNY